MFPALDHIAIVVEDTEEALSFYRDRLGLSVKASEIIVQSQVRLTHLDLGNLDLQLVEPLSEDHVLKAALKKNGESLHHLCWNVPDMETARKQVQAKGLRTAAPEPHSGVNEKSAMFLDPNDTRGVLGK